MTQVRKWGESQNPDKEMEESQKPRRDFPDNERKTEGKSSAVYFKNHPK